MKGLHWRTSLEIHKLLKDNEDFCICYNDGEEEEEEGASPEKKVQDFIWVSNVSFLSFFFFLILSIDFELLIHR